MKIAEALRKAAKSESLSDVQIAAIVGVSQQTAGRWLAGKGEPRLSQGVTLIRAIPEFGKLVGLEGSAG